MERSRPLADLDRERLRRLVQRGGAPQGEERFMETLETIRLAWLPEGEGAPERMRKALAEHQEAMPLL